MNLRREITDAYSSAVEILGYLATMTGAYLLGSIPTGYLVARARGVDIRSVGSGNIGATNALRVLGRTAGGTVLAVDALKGFLAVWLVPGMVQHFYPIMSGDGRDTLEWLKIIGGVGAVLGHNYPCWLGFRGGKGIATSAGVMLGLFPLVLAIILGVWIVVCATTRFVSVASICAALALPVSAWAVGASNRIIAVALFMGGFAIFKHKGNIKRLADGSEPRIGAAGSASEETK